MPKTLVSTVNCFDLPKKPSQSKAYRLLPKGSSPEYYRERVDRNIGWITEEEQRLLQRAVIGIAGCGGMGGALASVFVRLGVGEVRIADCEVFDTSNINRQFAATRTTVGTSKAFATARMVREITDDTTLVVYPQGINENTAAHFAAGCDVICDEIEFWAIGSRILLHQVGRGTGIPIFNCNTVGMSTRLFLFTAQSQTMEERFGLTLEEGFRLQYACQNGTATADERTRVMELVICALVPELPEYCPEDTTYRTAVRVRERLLQEGRASILATNPPMATGFLADHVLLHLLRGSNVQRTIVSPPETPGYLIFDAALMKAHVRSGVRMT